MASPQCREGNEGHNEAPWEKLLRWGGERLRGRRGGWLARSQDQSHPGQEAPSETLRATPADGRRGSRWAPKHMGWLARSRCPFPPHCNSNAGFFNQAEGGLGPGPDLPPLLAIWACPTTSPSSRQGWGPAKAGPGREPQDLGGDSGKQPQHQRAADGGTPVGWGSPHPEGGSFRLSNRLRGLHNAPPHPPTHKGPGCRLSPSPGRGPQTS